MKEIQEKLYNLYVQSIDDNIIEVKEEKRIKSEPGQVRLFFMQPQEYVLVIRKEDDLNIVVPLTNIIELAITDKYPPLIEWRGKKFVPLPFWVYVHDKLIEKYSIPVFMIKKNTDIIKEYVKTARTSGIGEYREKFIKTVANRFKDISLSSVIATV